MTMRIGNGFDVHALVAGRPLVLGGVTIPHDRGLAGHSDADVLLHAIADAILGALALGDIGAHFPDTDPRWKGADSRVLLRHVVGARVRRAGWRDRQRRRDGDRAGAEARAARAGDAREHRGATSAATLDACQRQGDDDRAPGLRRARGGHRGAGDRAAADARPQREPASASAQPAAAA